MNCYSAEFFARCPSNGARVHYRWRLESAVVVPVEEINDALDERRSGYHETFADMLWARFGGRQTLTAEHHGVQIITVRPAE